MRSAPARSVVALALLVAGCGTWDSQERARTVAAEVLECPGVTVEPRGGERFHATGCGGEIDIACMSGANEPRCEQVRIRGSRTFVPGTSGGQTEAETETETETEAGPPRAGAPVSDPIAEATLRALIDARRDDVLACAGSERVVVRVRTDANGAASVTLGGELADRPEEGCVRAALADLTGPPSIEVIHLVRAGAATP